MTRPSGDGRRAFFDSAPVTSRTEGKSGRRAFFGEDHTGAVPIVCSACGATSHVSLLDAGIRVAALSLWFPWRHHSRWIDCPACCSRTWCRINWTAPLRR